jgi:hypothetical protein
MCEATIVGDTAKLEWLARINLADEGALKAIIHTLGTKVYDNAIKHEEMIKWKFRYITLILLINMATIFLLHKHLIVKLNSSISS